MSRRPRITVALVAVVALAAGCTRRHQSAEPAPVSTTSAAVPATPDVSEVSPSSADVQTDSVTDSPSPSSSDAPSVSPSPSPSPSSALAPSPTPSTTPPPDTATTSAAPASSTPTAAIDPAQLARAKSLLVTGADLGPEWVSESLPADDEQGDLCGTVTAGAQNRLFDVANDVSNPKFDGAGRHEIARYQPGTAGQAARKMLDLLAHCTKLKQDFDGQQAEVNVVPIGRNTATFSLTFPSGAVNYGALAITNTNDYLSTSATYAIDAKTAATLATKLDDAARRKLTAAHLM